MLNIVEISKVHQLISNDKPVGKWKKIPLNGSEPAWFLASKVDIIVVSAHSNGLVSVGCKLITKPEKPLEITIFSVFGTIIGKKLIDEANALPVGYEILSGEEVANLLRELLRTRSKE